MASNFLLACFAHDLEIQAREGSLVKTRGVLHGGSANTPALRRKDFNTGNCILSKPVTINALLQTCFGVKAQEGVYSASVNSGLLAAIIERGDIKMMNVGHDHINDYCASFQGVHFCYAGGFGYHAYNTEGELSMLA
jgi:hypothetical protein